ncbi:hypothetical protein PM082_007287 [Marasmius tenuissimus]|nr:hypothetical protein PM082_007287 [Marasmius tenuissimus]
MSQSSINREHQSASARSERSPSSSHLQLRLEIHDRSIPDQPPPLTRRTCIPLPSQHHTAIPVKIHPLLASPESYGLCWDLKEPFESAPNSRFCLEALKDAATVPGLPSMAVVHPQLLWPIMVYANEPRTSSGERKVAVMDVFVAISRYMMLRADRQGRGIRADLLEDKRVFLGLKADQVDGDVWELVI